MSKAWARETEPSDADCVFALSLSLCPPSLSPSLGKESPLCASLPCRLNSEERSETPVRDGRDRARGRKRRRVRRKRGEGEGEGWIRGEVNGNNGRKLLMEEECEKKNNNGIEMVGRRHMPVWFSDGRNTRSNGNMEHQTDRRSIRDWTSTGN